MPFQLFGCENEFLIWDRIAGVGVLGVVVGMNDELAVYGDGLVFRVIKVETAAETLSRYLALRV